jgi:ribulose 1,5-bisphosphate synthetase/thiazole synthase
MSLSWPKLHERRIIPRMTPRWASHVRSQFWVNSHHHKSGKCILVACMALHTLQAQLQISRSAKSRRGGGLWVGSRLWVILMEEESVGCLSCIWFWHLGIMFSRFMTGLCCGESPPVASTLMAQTAQAITAIVVFVLEVDFLLSLSIMWLETLAVSRGKPGCF